MFLGIKVLEKTTSIKKSLYFFGLSLFKIFTNYSVNNERKTKFYFFGIPIFEMVTSYAVDNKIKTKVYFINIPVIFILSRSLEKRINVLGIPLYNKKSETEIQAVRGSIINDVKKELEDKYMEMELLIKTVASSIREIKRLENKDIN